MERREIQEITGVKAIRKLSETTTVIEMMHGGIRPATPAEIAMWSLLTRQVRA